MSQRPATPAIALSSRCGAMPDAADRIGRVPRRLCLGTRSRRRRARRHRPSGDGLSRDAAAELGRTAQDDEPVAAGRGGCARPLVVPGDDRHRARTSDRMHAPLGGLVVVFGPNNFPFAFNSVAGGDFVAAVAAGNPVLAKANTSHPGTSRLMAQIAFDAAQAAGLPPGMVQLIYRTPPDVGFALVSHPKVAATGFTGSKHAGLQLKAAAERAGKPIYLEMSSVNPVFVLPAALGADDRRAAIAKELADSCALGSGQFCTRPGVTVVLDNAARRSLCSRRRLRTSTAGNPGTLLGAAGREEHRGSARRPARATGPRSSPAAPLSRTGASASPTPCCAPPATRFSPAPKACRPRRSAPSTPSCWRATSRRWPTSPARSTAT